MSLTAFIGRCPHCGHDHGANTFDAAIGILTPSQQAQLDEQFANYAKQKPHLYGNCIEANLREQVEKLTKERDIKEHCIVQLEAEDLRMKEQLAALAEQNEKLRYALENHNGNYKLTRKECAEMNAILEPPDLASPVLNRIRAEGMEDAAQIGGPDDSYQDEWFAAKADSHKKIMARANELRKESK